MIAHVCTVRERGWILPQYLTAVDKALTGYEHCHVFLDDASTDETRDMLQDYALGHDDVLLLRNSKVFLRCTSSRDARDRQSLYQHLAENRNRLMDAAIDLAADIIFSLDSDILVTPNIVARLLSHDQPYVSSVVCNVRTVKPEEVVVESWQLPTNYMKLNDDGHVVHPEETPLYTTLPCAASGACFLAQGEALWSRFDHHPQGEDLAYCEDLRQHGVPLFIDTYPQAIHILRPSDLTTGLATLTKLEDL